MRRICQYRCAQHKRLNILQLLTDFNVLLFVVIVVVVVDEDDDDDEVKVGKRVFKIALHTYIHTHTHNTRNLRWQSSVPSACSSMAFPFRLPRHHRNH